MLDFFIQLWSELCLKKYDMSYIYLKPVDFELILGSDL